MSLKNLITELGCKGNISNSTLIGAIIRHADGIGKIGPFTKLVDGIFIVHISCLHCLFLYRQNRLVIIKEKGPIMAFNVKLDDPRNFREYVGFIRENGTVINRESIIL